MFRSNLFTMNFHFFFFFVLTSLSFTVVFLRPNLNIKFDNIQSIFQNLSDS